jgi:transposase
MDNASFHKAPIIRDLIEKEGCQLIYLPPYSPELNPIEKYWSVLKKYIKKVNCIFTDMWECIEYAILCTDTFGLPKCD